MSGGASYVPFTGGSIDNTGPIVQDAGGRSRISQLTTLFDGKTLNADDPFLWSTAGTGTATYDANIVNLTCTAGQYIVRQSKIRAPYFSGKSQQAEVTFFNLKTTVAGLTKRVGYYNSSINAPFSTNLDGVFLEATDQGVSLVIANNGVEIYRVTQTQWDNPAIGYDWAAFTVVMFDFLWLGGAVLRLFLKNPAGGFTLCHTFNFAGSFTGTFMASPNHSVRYEMVSTTGAGAFATVCSQISSEGSINESSKSLAIYNPVLYVANTIATIYALKGLKKATGYIDTPIRVDSYGVALGTSDNGMAMLLLNPTLSAGLTYATSGAIENGTGTNQKVTNTGRVLACLPIGAAGASASMPLNALSWIGSSVAGVSDELVLAYMPITTNQSVTGFLNLALY